MSASLLQTRPALISPNEMSFVSVPKGRMKGIDYAKRHRCTFLGFALIEVLLGICSVGIGIAMLPICNADRGCEDDYFSDYLGFWTRFSADIWGGALVVVFGIFGLAQACRPSTGTIVTNLMLSIFGILLSISIFGVEVRATCSSIDVTELIILHGISAGIYFILFIIFLVVTSNAGVARGCCCMDCCWDQYGNVQYVDGTQTQNVVALPNGPAIVLQDQSQYVSGVSYPRNPPSYTPVNLQPPGPSTSGTFGVPNPDITAQESELPVKTKWPTCDQQSLRVQENEV